MVPIPTQTSVWPMAAATTFLEWGMTQWYSNTRVAAACRDGLQPRARNSFADGSVSWGPRERPPVQKPLPPQKFARTPWARLADKSPKTLQSARERLGRAARAPWLWDLENQETALEIFPEPSQNYATLRKQTITVHSWGDAACRPRRHVVPGLTT